MKSLGIALLATLALAAPAQARVSYKRPVAPALPTATITRLPAADVATVCGAPDALGCSDGKHVNLAPDAPRWTRVHELGHIADAQSMSDAERSAFLKLMPVLGWPTERDAGWFGYDEEGAYYFGAAEIFADAYASCRLGHLPQVKPNRHGVITGRGDRFGSYGYDPGTNNRARRICARIARWVSTPRTTN